MEILNIPMALIHVFFVPMIALYIYYRRNNKALVLNGEFLTTYAILTSVVITIAKIIASVITKTTSITLKIDSTYFALIAIFVAFLLPYVYEAFKKNFEVKCEIENGKDGANNG